MARLIIDGKPCLDRGVAYTRDVNGYMVHDDTLDVYLARYGRMAIHVTEKEVEMPDGSEFQVLVEHSQAYDCHMVTNEDVCIARVQPGPKKVGHVSDSGHRRFRFRLGGVCAQVGKDFDSDVFMLIEVPLLAHRPVVTRGIGTGSLVGSTSPASSLPADPTRAVEVTVWRIKANGQAPKIFRV